MAKRDFRGSVLRGAVFFMGMSSWGSQRVKELKVPFSVILPTIAAVLEYVCLGDAVYVLISDVKTC